MSLIRKYQQGGKPTGSEFTYSGRPNSSYRKDKDGNWYIKNESTHHAFVPIKDPTGSRSQVLNSQAKVRTTTLRVDSEVNPNIEKEYLTKLKELENSIKAGYNNGVWKPHSSVEGGSDTIAYGHKLQKGENFSNGLTEKRAEELLKKDYLEHKNRAKSHIDSKYGAGTFDKLPSTKQVLLTDYEYNVGLSKFPSFVKGVVKDDKDLMLKEYKRYTGGLEMTSRNDWTLSMIKKLRNGGLIYKK